MSAESRVATRYAKAFVSVASQEGNQDALYADAELIMSTIEGSRELSNALSSPIIKAEKKAAILKEIFSSKVTDLTNKLFNLVVEKNRTSALYEIVIAIKAEFDAVKNIQRATVVTSTPLNASTKDALVAKVTKSTGKTVVLEEKVDASLIGGYILTVGDKQLDCSVKSQLQQLKVAFN
ncbi:ATP synthase F1 subunit delta [Flammeovirga yaeyamensis]|uniref:ATP synthase subunit delta n=1 Tax=Flammeovirga yaeyamensis TaxID=367791 RepID=A0AAX1N4Y1_9BACT|nr:MULTISPECIES: ATP synthase F1 subunit delta [Flammeovirga]ANQ49995.1 ATP synthase F1 subunit delta [Flammeovirga sp. MY04]MBB3700492.1 F-type H+-transporting ATPase subunit delta [Flammeovirga yaeyamensis]NMF36886.1 ATP synthase F1 subunit delta [Flammeovirga yaeyamensis]QWG02566.1 ATP synthase F1 subunit delta [Flammeovirga yaeyamensis]